MAVVKPRKTRLSVIALQTHHTLVALLFLVALVLGAIYLFLLNHVAFRGYVLQQEMQQNAQLAESAEILDMRISKAQAQEFLAKGKPYKSLVVQNRPRFVVLKPNLTASVESGTVRK